jgi:hypothetical protein
LIASFSRNFIFLKTHKTAGTSIEIALAPHCAPQDIVTPLQPEDERKRIVGRAVQARNYADPATMAAFAGAMLRGDDRAANKAMASLAPAGHFYNHMPAFLVRTKLPAAFWSGAFKFGVERHPYEKAVSWAWFQLHRTRRPPTDFAAVLADAPRFIDDTLAYLIDGRVAVDRLLRYERLDAELGEVAAQLGLPPLTLPRAKGQFRQDLRPAAEILTAAQKQAIHAATARTFELMGYER